MNTSPTGRVEAVQRKALNALSYVIYLASRECKCVPSLASHALAPRRENNLQVRLVDEHAAASGEHPRTG